MANFWNLLTKPHLLALIGAVMLSIGCQRNRPPALAIAPNADAIEVRRNVQFADLPAPYGFKFNRQYSRNFQGSSLRGGTVVYDGSWNVAETNDWYLAEMPKTGWQLVSAESPSAYDITHLFSKIAETATVRIWRVNGKTQVVISLAQNAE